MINNKMLKEPLFLEFTSSGVLDRVEHKQATISETANQEDYRLLSKKETEDSLQDKESGNERENTNPSGTCETKYPARESDGTDGTDGYTNMDTDNRYWCFDGDHLTVDTTECIRSLRLNFCSLIGCPSE